MTDETAPPLAETTVDTVDVTLVDYGLGNLGSLQRGLERVGATVNVSSDPDCLARADALVLSGVGAFAECARRLAPFRDALLDAAADTPLLGVCVGFQLLLTESTEGAPEGETVAGLDLIPGSVERLPADAVRVPHVGWNRLRLERDHPVLAGIDDGDYAYFVHSYGAPAVDRALAACNHGVEFTAMAANEAGHVLGTQFHPEKSAGLGRRLLGNFVRFAATFGD